MRPRYTKLWKRQLDLTAEALRSALSDQEIQPCWERVIDGLSNWREVDAQDVAQSLDQLVELVRARAPDLDHAWGVYLFDWLLCLAAKWSLPPEEFEEISSQLCPDRVYRLLPDNPLVIEPGEKVTASGFETTVTSHQYQLRDYVASLRPAGRRGRPPAGASDGRPARRGRQSSWLIKPEEARRALEMHRGGIHWTEIAGELFPELNLYDRRQREQARSRVNRRVERGRLLELANEVPRRRS